LGCRVQGWVRAAEAAQGVDCAVANVKRGHMRKEVVTCLGLGLGLGLGRRLGWG
jgi:hypothetical protein